MAEELISQYVDRAAFASDTDFIEAQLKRVFALQDQLFKTRDDVKAASTFKEISTAAESGAKAIDLVGKSVERLKFAVSDENIELQKNNALIQAANKEAKALGKEQAGLATEYDKQSKRLEAVKNQLKGLVAEGKDSGETFEKLRLEFTQLDTVLRKADKSVGDFRRNVGNYEGSAKIIVDALEKEKQKLEELEKARIRVQNAGASPLGQQGVAASATTITARAGGANPIGFNAIKEAQSLDVINIAIEETKQKVEALSKITEKENFLNIAGKVGDSTAQVKFFTKALIDLERHGLGNTDAAKQLRKELAELTDQIGGAKAEIKALSSDTRSFDLFAGSVSFAADALQTFAGAAVLAGASEEDAAQATKTLVAVQSVANGVKGIANELTTRGTAANKLYAFSQRQIAILTDSSATSLSKFKAALITTGFGAIIVGIGLLVANLDKVKKALGFASEAQEAYNETLKEYREGAKSAIESTTKVGVAFQQAKEGVISKEEALFEYNKTLGDAFGKTNDLAEAERLYTEKADTYIKVQGLKAQANALFARSGEVLSKGITADLEDQTGIIDKAIAGLKLQLGFAKSGFEGLSEVQQKGVDEAKKNAKDLGDALQKEGEDILKQAQLLANGAKINTNTDFDKEQEKKAKEAAEKAKKLLEERLKAELDLQKRNLAAARAILLENENEIIRSNQRIVDSESTSFKDRLASLENISQAKKNIAAIEFAQAIKSEKEIKDGKIVEIKKSQAEIEAATLSFNNKIKAINDDLLKAQLDAQKANAAKIKEEIENERQERLNALDASTQAERDRLQRENNENIVALNERYKQGKISLEEYNKERTRLEIGYHAESLENEIAYQQKLLEIIDLPEEQKAEALRRLSDLQAELSELDVQRTKDAEAEKLAAIKKTLDEISASATTAFEFIGGLLNANSEIQKNKIKEEQDAAEARAARDIEIIEASSLKEEKKAAKKELVNKRLAIQKEQFEKREREINLQNARFEKSKNIFSITLSTAKAVAEASPDPFRIALAIALGAAQLGIAVATPLPKYYKGKNVTAGADKYEGWATVNEYRDEVIRRTDGKVEFPKGRNVVTWLGSDDQVFPSLDAYLDDVIKSTHKGAMQRPQVAKVIVDNSEAKKTNALLQKLINKPSANVNIYDNGHAYYEIEQTNW